MRSSLASVCPVRGWTQPAWTVRAFIHNLPQSPPLSFSVHLSFCFRTGSRPGTGRNSSLQIPLCLGAASSMPQLCFPALEFPERQKAGKALMITPVRDLRPETFRRLLKVTQQVTCKLRVGLRSPDTQTTLATLSSRTMGI